MYSGIAFRKEVSAVSSMETFIVAASLVAAAIGSLVLLSYLAGQRAYWLKAFDMKLRLEDRDRTLERDKADIQHQDEQLDMAGQIAPEPGSSPAG